MARAPEATGPVGAVEFAALVAMLGPYERAPEVGVAVSGGADSMALLLLARDWAEERCGRVVAFTVDHGLRPEAAAEARQVGDWAAESGVVHRVLSWQGERPAGDLQAAARRARYRLLEAACAADGVLHLLLAHHLGDVAETFLIRLARGSGLDGLAAMSAIVERPDCRLLRPLLGIPRDRLRATLETRGQGWIEDPSNDNPAFARVRLRQSRTLLAREGLGEARLAATARRLARARAALEPAVARLLARAVTPHPWGFVHLDGAVLGAAPAELRLRALAALLGAVGGGEYPPRAERLERLSAEISAGLVRGRTLAGCRILPARGRLLICREAAAMAPATAAAPGGKSHWDGRFRVALLADAPAGLTLGPLGPTGGEPPWHGLPAAVRRTLPAIRGRGGIVSAPSLPHFPGTGVAPGLASAAMLLRVTRPATGAGIKVV
jgi:tRNA(Ile)-lysidine synthase